MYYTDFKDLDDYIGEQVSNLNKLVSILDGYVVVSGILLGNMIGYVCLGIAWILNMLKECVLWIVYGIVWCVTSLLTWIAIILAFIGRTVAQFFTAIVSGVKHCFMSFVNIFK